MLTLQNYFGRWINHPDATAERKLNAVKLIAQVNRFVAEAQQSGIMFHENINTESIVSGNEYGGFRPQSCPQGAANSSHKEGAGVDIFDPENKLDQWIDQFEDGQRGNSVLEKFGLYREAPESTLHWCHLTTRAPDSGHRTFLP